MSEANGTRRSSELDKQLTMHFKQTKTISTRTCEIKTYRQFIDEATQTYFAYQSVIEGKAKAEIDFIEDAVDFIFKHYGNIACPKDPEYSPEGRLSKPAMRAYLTNQGQLKSRVMTLRSILSPNGLFTTRIGEKPRGLEEILKAPDIKSMQKSAEWKKSTYLYWAHSFFRGRDLKLENTYRALSELDPDSLDNIMSAFETVKGFVKK